MTAAKAGSTYQALMNLSVPRLNDPDKMTDLVMAGDTVILTDAQAKPFLEATPPRVRKAAEAGSPLPRILPKHVSGQMRGVMGTGGRHGSAADARPDPQGSSHIQVNIPEGEDPHTDYDGNAEDEGALDLPPGSVRVTAGAR